MRETMKEQETCSFSPRSQAKEIAVEDLCFKVDIVFDDVSLRSTW